MHAYETQNGVEFRSVKSGPGTYLKYEPSEEVRAWPKVVNGALVLDTIARDANLVGSLRASRLEELRGAYEARYFADFTLGQHVFQADAASIENIKAGVTAALAGLELDWRLKDNTIAHFTSAQFITVGLSLFARNQALFAAWKSKKDALATMSATQLQEFDPEADWP